MRRSLSVRLCYGALVLAFSLLVIGRADLQAAEVARPSAKVIPLHTLRHSRAVTNLAWSPDSRLVATIGILSPDITIWDARSGKRVRTLRREIGFAEPIAFSPDGKYLITSAAENRVGIALTVWEVGSWKVHRHVSALFADKPPIWSAARLMAVAADRSRLAYAPNRLRGSSVAILETWAMVQTLKIPKLTVFSALALARDGNTLAVGGGRKRSIFIVDMRSNEITRTITAHPGYFIGIASLAFSPDGRFLASGHNGQLGVVPLGDGTTRTADAPPDPVRVWRVSDGTLVAGARGGAEAVRGVAWSPDGSYIAFPANNAPSRQFEIRLWDIESDRQTTVMEFPNAAFTAAFSPDGKYLAGVGGKTARIVEIRK